MRIRSGFTYLETHSAGDFDIRINNIMTPPPEEKEVRDSVPYMNGDYDFSNMFGASRWSNRKISISCFIIFNDVTVSIDDTVNDIVNWLLGKGWNRLDLDHQANRYYIAKCTSIVPAEPDYDKRKIDISIEFEAKPFAKLVTDDSEVL